MTGSTLPVGARPPPLGAAWWTWRRLPRLVRLWALAPAALVSGAVGTPPPPTLATAPPMVRGQVTACAEPLEATYYHPSLAGEVMANGQRYDPRNPRIASSNRHRRGTLLRLTRAERTAAIVVEVMDRGSEQLGLDLSEAAFEALAPLRAGRIAVCVEVLH